MFLMALNDIKPEERLLVDYGEDYWPDWRERTTTFSAVKALTGHLSRQVDFLLSQDDLWSLTTSPVPCIPIVNSMHDIPTDAVFSHDQDDNSDESSSGDDPEEESPRESRVMCPEPAGYPIPAGDEAPGDMSCGDDANQTATAQSGSQKSPAQAAPMSSACNDSDVRQTTLDHRPSSVPDRSPADSDQTGAQVKRKSTLVPDYLIRNRERAQARMNSSKRRAVERPTRDQKIWRLHPHGKPPKPPKQSKMGEHRRVGVIRCLVGSSASRAACSKTPPSAPHGISAKRKANDMKPSISVTTDPPADRETNERCKVEMSGALEAWLKSVAPVVESGRGAPAPAPTRAAPELAAATTAKPAAALVPSAGGGGTPRASCAPKDAVAPAVGPRSSGKSVQWRDDLTTAATHRMLATFTADAAHAWQVSATKGAHVVVMRTPWHGRTEVEDFAPAGGACSAAGDGEDVAAAATISAMPSTYLAPQRLIASNEASPSSKAKRQHKAESNGARPAGDEGDKTRELPKGWKLKWSDRKQRWYVCGYAVHVFSARADASLYNPTGISAMSCRAPQPGKGRRGKVRGPVQAHARCSSSTSQLNLMVRWGNRESCAAEALVRGGH